MIYLLFALDATFNTSNDTVLKTFEGSCYTDTIIEEDRSVSWTMKPYWIIDWRHESGTAYRVWQENVSQQSGTITFQGTSEECLTCGTLNSCTFDSNYNDASASIYLNIKEQCIKRQLYCIPGRCVCQDLGRKDYTKDFKITPSKGNRKLTSGIGVQIAFELENEKKVVTLIRRDRMTNKEEVFNVPISKVNITHKTEFGGIFWRYDINDTRRFFVRDYVNDHTKNNGMLNKPWCLMVDRVPEDFLSPNWSNQANNIQQKMDIFGNPRNYLLNSYNLAVSNLKYTLSFEECSNESSMSTQMRNGIIPEIDECRMRVSVDIEKNKVETSKGCEEVSVYQDFANTWLYTTSEEICSVKVLTATSKTLPNVHLISSRVPSTETGPTHSNCYTEEGSNVMYNCTIESVEEYNEMFFAVKNDINSYPPSESGVLSHAVSFMESLASGNQTNWFIISGVFGFIVLVGVVVYLVKRHLNKRRKGRDESTEIQEETQE